MQRAPIEVVRHILEFVPRYKLFVADGSYRRTILANAITRTIVAGTTIVREVWCGGKWVELPESFNHASHLFLIDRHQFIVWPDRSACYIYTVQGESVVKFEFYNSHGNYRCGNLGSVRAFKMDESNIIMSRGSFVMYSPTYPYHPQTDNPHAFLKVNIHDGSITPLECAQPCPRMSLVCQIGPTTFLIQPSTRYCYPADVKPVSVLNVDLESNSFAITPTAINIPIDEFGTCSLFSNYDHTQPPSKRIVYLFKAREYTLQPFVVHEKVIPWPHLLHLPDNYTRFFIVGQEVLILDEDHIVWRARTCPQSGSWIVTRWISAPNLLDIHADMDIHAEMLFLNACRARMSSW